MTTIAADAERLGREIETLAAISEAPAPAVTRVLFSPEDRRARDYVSGLCREAGLVVRTDGAGNQFARWTGREPDLPAVATGSHMDAIPNAGKYDGVVGVLGGLEALRALQRGGFRPRRSIELIVFTAEEPTRFGLGCLGSRLLSGALEPARAAELRDPEGRSLAEWRQEAGWAGRLEDVRLPAGAYEAFVELHIEQGPLLERHGQRIGAVEKIAAPAAARVQLNGVGGHAGAVLMPERRDAGLAAAEIALAVEKAALGSASPDAVGTTGVFRIRPGAINSVPAEAWLEIDFRDTDLAAREKALGELQADAEAVCARRRVEMRWEWINRDPPAICCPRLVDAIVRAAEKGGLSCRRMVSRAYHDSLFMALVCPTGMIFIPCRHGWSHRPDEFAAPEDIAAGVQVLAHVLAERAGA